MKTILLLAGRSRRFWPLKDKYLFSLCGKTVLEHQMERLKEAGCRELILVTGKHNKKEVSLLAPAGARIVEQKDLDAGMQGALLDALPLCGREPVLIVGSDLIDPSAYRLLRTRIQRKKVDGLILARKVSRYFPGGYLILNGKCIAGIVEKPGEGKEPSDLVNLVAHAHRNASTLLAALRKTKATQDNGYERALDSLLRARHYEAVPYDGPWHTVKYPWHLLELLPSLLATQKKSVHRTAQIHRTAVIEGPALLAQGVRVLPHATIVGPCFIGPHTIIGTNALVRSSSIGAHCVVGYNTDVKGSALSDHVWTHSTYVGDSVVGTNVAFGAGSVTGNLRLDEEEIDSHVSGERVATGLRKFGTVIGDDTRVGIHTSINPGIKIGTSSFIGSGVTVMADVPDSTFVKMVAGEMHMRRNKSSPPQPGGREEFREKF